MRKVLKSGFLLFSATALLSGATAANWVDVESSEQNIVTSGQLDIELNGSNPAFSPMINIAANDGFKPGDTNQITFTVQNIGSVTGSTLRFQIPNGGYSSDDDVLYEPETDSDSAGVMNGDGVGGDTSGGSAHGELHNQLLIWINEGLNLVTGPIRVADLVGSPIELAGGVTPNQLRTFDVVYQYEDSVTNNWTMGDSVNFSLEFELSQ